MNVIAIDTNEPQTSPAKPLAGLDAVRVCAAFAVVMLHATVPYLQYQMPGLAWSTHDAPSPLVDVISWTIELFVMPLFLVIAGILAWRTLSRRGASALVTSRAKRLLVPFLFGCVVILPLDLHVWVLGWVLDGEVPLVKLRSFKFDPSVDKHLWGTSHLWFLQYLFLYVAALAGCALIGCERIARKISWPVRRPVIGWLMLLAATALVTASVSPEVVWGFQHSFLPVPSKFIYSATFFALGVLIAVNDPGLNWLRVNAHRLTWFAVPATFVAVTAGRAYLGGAQWASNEMVGLVTVTGAVAAALAIIAMALRHVERLPLTFQYLAAASFWVYLIHHPFVGLIHIDLKLLLPEAPPELKFVLTMLVASVFSVATYEAFVRKSWLGGFLGMNWQFPRECEREPGNQKEREKACETGENVAA